MAVINVDDIYILDETGAQVDKVTGLFTKDEDTTSGEKAFAQLNIGTAGSNRNLLDNPWFTVNQRQITTPSSPISGYPADRWYGTYSAVTSDGVTLPAQNAVDLYQKLEPDLCAALVGKTVTVSTLEQDGTISTYTLVFPAYGSGEGGNYNMGNGIGCFVQNISGYQRVRFRISDQRTTPFALRAAKLELGSVSTIANDTMPNYAEELAKCQRYFWRLGGAQYLNIVSSAMAESSAAVFGICRFPVPMRAMPTISTHGAIVAWSGISTTTQSISVTLSRNDNSSPTTNQTFVGIKATGSGFTVGQRYDIQIRNDASGYVDFSADL